MSARIAKLEALLARVQENVSKPRPVALVAEAAAPAETTAPAEVAGVDELELDEPGGVEAPAAAEMEEPAEMAAPMELDEPVAFAEPVAFDEPALDEPAALEAPAVLEQPTEEVVDLDEEGLQLDAPDEFQAEAPAEPIDLDAEIDLDAPAPVAAAPEAAPVPEALAPVGEVTFGEEPVEEIQDLDSLEEVDLVEEFSGEDLELDAPEGEEPPPESHSAPVASASLRQAMEPGEEPAPLTPPPESGEEPSAQAVGIPGHDGPTMEQLGETISLDEGPARDFEIDEPLLEESAAEPAASKLEAELPAGAVPAEDLQLPADAVQELDRVRLGETQMQPEVVARPVISTNVVEFVDASRSFAPKSFLELLDASLEL